MDIHLDKRQKIILVILIILVAFLVWQILGLTNNKKSKATPVKKTVVVTEPIKEPSPTTPPVIKAPIITQPQLIPPQQAEYLQAIDQYQLAQIKRMLAEQVAATAAANASTAKSKAEINHIIASTSSTPNITTLLPGNTAVDPALQPIQSNIPVINSSNIPYQVSFIGNKDGNWSAILSHNGDYTIVSVGTVLKDQSVVTEINSNGVSLKNGENTLFIPFQASLTG